MTKEKNQTRFHAIGRSVANSDLMITSGGVPGEPYELTKLIPLNKLFFYIVQQIKFPDQCCKYEKGVGLLEKNNGEVYLKRVVYFEYFDGDTVKKRVLTSSFNNFYEDDYILISSFIPEDYSKALILPHSVLCSIEAGVPSPVHLEEGTLLGRLDGRVQSIDNGELLEILGSKEVPGAIRWNSGATCFEGYDGNKWRKLRWDDDNS